MEWRMLAITGRGDKADIRQIVGRDRVAWRNFATSPKVCKAVVVPSALMSKGLQRF